MRLKTSTTNSNKQVSGEIASAQVRITHLQAAIEVAVNSDLLFPSGGWQMPPDERKLIARIAPILTPIQQTQILVNAYSDNVANGPEPRVRGITSNQK